MAKWQFTRPGKWDYPGLGFTAVTGDVIQADAAIDAWWDQVADATPVTIPVTPPGPGYVEPADRSILSYDVATNKYVPKALGTLMNDVAADENSDFAKQQKATYVSILGANVARFIERAQAGESLKIAGLGDSVEAGQTVTNPATDGFMLLLPVDLATRFPNSTFTSSNRAASGFTSAQAFILGRVNSAVTDAADLYIISFGKNDDAWEVAAPGVNPSAGYPRTSSLAQIEMMCRIIRTQVPKADIILLAENPYRPLGGAANDALEAYNAGVRRVAATYGAEFVDAYTPFTLLSDADLLAAVADGTHPSTIGHRLMADTILEHLPADFSGPSNAPGAPAQYGLFAPEKIEVNTLLWGWTRLISPITFGSGTWTNGGAGWSGTSSNWVNSTVGGYFELTFYGTEMLASISTAVADGLRATITVDGVDTVIDHDFTLGKAAVGASVPIVTGLAVGTHTVRVTITAGTLRLVDVAWLEGRLPKSPGPDIVYTAMDDGATQGPVAIDSAGGTTIIYTKSFAMPTGWNRAAVAFGGFVRCYVKGDTTTQRTVEFRIRISNVIVQTQRFTVPAVTQGATATTEFTFGISHMQDMVASGTAQIEVRMTSTDKTQMYWNSFALRAIQQRIG